MDEAERQRRRTNRAAPTARRALASARLDARDGRWAAIRGELEDRLVADCTERLLGWDAFAPTIRHNMAIAWWMGVIAGRSAR